MSQNFYIQSPETSTTSLSDNQNNNNTSNNPSHSRNASSTQRSDTSNRADKTTTAADSYFNHSNGYGRDSDFYDDDEEDDDDNPLPFPAALSRADFLGPTFDPSEYLSTLASSRYQTLEDLRGELRTRSQQLNQELLDLVNAHHDDFTGLGSSLTGGDEKVEEVRVGVLGFRREVEDVRRRVAEREAEVDGLLGERRRLRDEIELGRKLLGFEERVALLERRLGLASTGTAPAGHGGDEQDEQSNSSDEEEEEIEDENIDTAAAAADGATEADHASAVSLLRISRRVQDLKGIEHMADRIGTDHPFVKAQEERTGRLRETLLLDLGALLKQLSQPQERNADQRLKVLNLYGEIGASGKAIEVLKSSK